METLIQDIRFGIRSLLKHRAFTAIALMTLALGVGVNSTIFSAVNATLMRPLSVSHPENLAYVFNGNSGSIFSYPDYAEMRDQNHVFDGLIAWGGITASLNSNDQSDLVNGAVVTGNYFQVLGVGAEKVVTAPLNINLLRYTKPQGREFYRQAVERVEAIPGVQSASVARIVALGGGSSVRSLAIEGRAGSDNQFRSEGVGSSGSDPNSVSVNVVGPKYFQTMGISLLRGRDFNLQDTEEKPDVVIVNDSFAKRHFPGQEVIGRRISFNGTAGPWKEIVGVVHDSKYVTLGEPPTPFAYLPHQQNHETGMTLHVRAAGNPTSIVAAVRSEVQALEKNLPVNNPTPMSEWIVNSLYAARMGAILVGVFATLALVLASIGLYGVMSFAVSQRTRELGIRVALGAQAADVFRLVLWQGTGLVVCGVALGMGAAWIVTRFLTRFLTSFLYGISATDRLTFAIIPAVLACVAGIACYIPARRATKVDPLVALRYE